MRNNQLTYVHNCAEMVPFTRQTVAVDKALIDNLSQGVIFVDDIGVVRFINARAEEWLHVHRDSVIGKRLDMLTLRTPLYRVLSENFGGLCFEMSINGMAIEAKTTELKSADGNIFGEITELRDVTAEKKERRLFEEYIAMMIHDLKSPLTTIIGYVQMVRKEVFGEINDSLAAPFEKIERSGFTLLAMIEDILDSCRLEAGLLQINRHHGDIKPVLAECCREKSQEAMALGIDFKFSIEDDIPEFMFDSKHIPRVFANLIGNAVKFTPRNGSVRVTSANRDGNLHVVIEDTGIGIPREDLPRIFNKYYRGAGASGFQGTGLGLSISKAIVEAHGGVIEVESNGRKGSRFIVKIPCGGYRGQALLTE